MSSWRDIARATINRVHQGLPEAMTLKDRKAAIDAAYPFGTREYWPYKAWCKARRAYLEQYGLAPLGARRTLDFLPRDPVTGRPLIR